MHLFTEIKKIHKRYTRNYKKAVKDLRELKLLLKHFVCQGSSACWYKSKLPIYFHLLCIFQFNLFQLRLHVLPNRIENHTQ